MMQQMIPDGPAMADLEDVTEDLSEDVEVDGLGILRAVVDAWQNLIVTDGAANAE
jgi:hypothetical protein